jgi:hypothetical protein
MRLASYVAAYCVATLFALSVVSSGGCGSAKTPTSPTVTDVSGTWSGTSSYPNAPFQLTLSQSGSSLTGRYSDTSETDIPVTGFFGTVIGEQFISVHSVTAGSLSTEPSFVKSQFRAS